MLLSTPKVGCCDGHQSYQQSQEPRVSCLDLGANGEALKYFCIQPLQVYASVWLYTMRSSTPGPKFCTHISEMCSAVYQSLPLDAACPSPVLQHTSLPAAAAYIAVRFSSVSITSSVLSPASSPVVCFPYFATVSCSAVLHHCLIEDLTRSMTLLLSRWPSHSKSPLPFSRFVLQLLALFLA